MGEQKSERELFSYAVNLEKRVRSDHPLRRVAAAIDFKFVRAEVARCYGAKGHVSVDPGVLEGQSLSLTRARSAVRDSRHASAVVN